MNLSEISKLYYAQDEETINDIRWAEEGETFDFNDTKLTIVSRFGGEGCGDELYVVFQIEGSDKLYIECGYYESNYGATWERGLSYAKAYTEVRYRPT